MRTCKRSKVGGIVVALALLVWAAAQAADRGPIQSGETKLGIDLAAAGTDSWTFSGYKGERVIINAVTTAGSLNTAILLYPPGGGAPVGTPWGY